MRHGCAVLTCLLAAVVDSACDRAPGRPSRHAEAILPGEITDFKTLYEQNCAGCHGPGGKGGGAVSLSNPMFLAIADDVTIRRTASFGVAGTPMPAFAQSAGGMLTDRQIDAIVRGIRMWANPAAVEGMALPPYAPAAPGNPIPGAKVYETYCSACHGPEGKGGTASSIVDRAYLSLVSDQDLRTVIITGRPEFGAPDFRNNIPGRPMAPQEISDVVAWLSAQGAKPEEVSQSPSTGSATRVIP